MIFEARGQFRDAEASFKARRTAQACGDQSHCWVPRIRLPSPACCSLSISHVLSQAADESAAGTVRGSRGRCAPRAAVAVEESGQVQSRHAALHRRPGRHSRRAGPLRRSRATGPRLRSRSAGPSASATILVSSVQQLSQLGGILNLQRKGRKRGRGLRADRQGDRQLGAGAAAGLRAQRRAHLPRSTPPGRSRPASPRREQLREAADRPGRRKSFRYRLGARHAGGRPDAGRARCRKRSASSGRRSRS